MARPTGPIRDQHRDLLAGLEELRRAGDRASAEEPTLSAEAASRCVAFLRERLIPHGRADETSLYPAVARLLGSPEVTRSMTRDHFEVGHLIVELEAAVAARDVLSMRRLLYGLYHLIRVHIAKEEEIYLPLLDEVCLPATLRSCSGT